MDENLLTFRIIAIKQETQIAKSYFLEEVSGKSVKFIPGQFLTFIIKLQNQEVRRSYSITSLPEEPLIVTVQKVDNGLISRHILNSWKTGDTLLSLPPMGRFTLPAQHEVPRDIFCFAAGSGIVPVLPQVRRLLMEEPQSIIHLVYSNTNEKRTLFLNEIESLSKEFPQMRVTFLFSNPDFRLQERGRLSNLYTQDLVKLYLRYEKEHAVFLICGPFTYMRMLGITLVSMHFPKENIRRENFLPEIMRSGYVSQPEFPHRDVVIQIQGQRHLLSVKSGQDILTAALEKGITLPYSCRGGVCGTCAAICKQGKVYMSINEVLTDEDLSKGWVLTCTGFPAQDETIISF
ncbi:2Fe-2S iron-sulfur cluster binding domain-containing protein [Flavihumibacter sp. R14]|nr:2Fe-2S iron-sulfur cluster binding domain-containing protein [Flavihumibacter soli]